MPEISSPLGRKTYGAAPQAAHYVVEDASTPAPQTQAPINTAVNVMEQRKALIQEQKQISHSAKERIEMLIGLTKARSTVTINGVTFGLRTLSAAEQREALMVMSRCKTDREALSYYRSLLLAYAIETIDGAKTSIMLGTDNIEEIMEIINAWDESMVGFLALKHTELVNETDLKYGFKEAEVAKVVEDIKK